MRAKMSGSNPPAPTPEKCWRCKGNHSKENRCPEWTNKLQCKLCLKKGHNASQCHKMQVPKCQLCKKIGHTAEKCRLRSSHSDKTVTVGDQNAIEAVVMNINRRPHSPTALAPKRGGGQRTCFLHILLVPPLEGDQPMEQKLSSCPMYASTRRRGSMCRGTCKVPATWIFRSSSIQNIATCSTDNI